MPDRKKTYREIWERIRETYYTGYMRVEHGLQAALYAELITLPGVNVVVEPGWRVGRPLQHPDLVIVEGGTITDIFELKFLPWGYPQFQKDINKLLGYLAHQEYPVRLSAYEDPDTYQERNLPLHQDVRLHLSRWGCTTLLPCSPTASWKKCRYCKIIRGECSSGMGRSAGAIENGPLSLVSENSFQWTI